MVIHEGVQNDHNSDPQTRYAIPNERLIRKSKAAHSAPTINARKINFNGDGAEVRLARDLPFTAPGLQWQGRPCVTTRQLQEQTELSIGRLKKKARATFSSASSVSENAVNNDAV